MGELPILPARLCEECDRGMGSVYPRSRADSRPLADCVGHIILR
jgi:hypothetical protein